MYDICRLYVFNIFEKKSLKSIASFFSFIKYIQPNLSGFTDSTYNTAKLTLHVTGLSKFCLFHRIRECELPNLGYGTILIIISDFWTSLIPKTVKVWHSMLLILADPMKYTNYYMIFFIPYLPILRISNKLHNCLSKQWAIVYYKLNFTNTYNVTK